jgi:hypothetical protein
MSSELKAKNVQSNQDMRSKIGISTKQRRFKKNNYLGKIFTPQSLRQRILCWYHKYLLHPGQTRTENNSQEYHDMECSYTNC